MSNGPLSWGDAMLSLLMQSGDFRRRMDESILRAGRAGNLDEAARRVNRVVAEMLNPYAQACQGLIGEALRRLRVQAQANGRVMPAGIELRASAGLLMMDWGKSEASPTHLTMRLVVTHAEMLDMPVCVERRVPLV